MTDWQKRALNAVRYIASVRAEFTTDAVWHILGETPKEPRQLGPVMSAAARERVCVATDRTHISTRPENHRRPLTVWESLTFGRSVPRPELVEEPQLRIVA